MAHLPACSEASRYDNNVLNAVSAKLWQQQPAEEQQMLYAADHTSAATPQGVSNPTLARKSKRSVPEQEKDSLYWEKRKKNNEAARKSRENKRKLDQDLRQRVSFLMEENATLRKELLTIKAKFGLPLHQRFLPPYETMNSGGLFEGDHTADQTSPPPGVDLSNHYSNERPIKKKQRPKVEKCLAEEEMMIQAGPYVAQTGYHGQAVWPAPPAQGWNPYQCEMAVSVSPPSGQQRYPPASCIQVGKAVTLGCPQGQMQPAAGSTDQAKLVHICPDNFDDDQSMFVKTQNMVATQPLNHTGDITTNAEYVLAPQEKGTRQAMVKVSVKSRETEGTAANGETGMSRAEDVERANTVQYTSPPPYSKQEVARTDATPQFTCSPPTQCDAARRCNKEGAPQSSTATRYADPPMACKQQPAGGEERAYDVDYDAILSRDNAEIRDKLQQLSQEVARMKNFVLNESA